MARIVSTPADLKAARRLGFCYLCGDGLIGNGHDTRDHVPPKNLFKVADRASTPLILPTHSNCNQDQSCHDQQIGQLVSLLWKDAPTERDLSSLDVVPIAPAGMAPHGAVEGLDLRRIIWRWIKAFHATLYDSYLPQMRFSVFEPFPGGNRIGEDTTITPERFRIVETIKQNRAVGRIDRIHIWNRTCLYECTWSRIGQHRAVCHWALDVYEWHRLGDIHNFPRRSCVGSYVIRGDVPQLATLATDIWIACHNTERLNAFEA